MIRNFGLDYAVKPRLILVADHDFHIALDKANFTALLYVFCPDYFDNENPCEIGFRFENEPFAETFLNCLIAWIEKSDGDPNAVEFTFLELNNGDYKLVISPNMELFRKRMIPQHLIDHVDPIMMVGARGLTIINRSDNYKKFKDKFIDGRRIIVRYYIANGENMKPSEKYFIATSFKFYSQKDVPENNIAYYQIEENIKKKKNLKPPKLQINDHSVLTERINRLKYFFPITYDNLVHNNWLESIISTINKSYSIEQKVQAICNLILLERLKLNNPNSVDINRKDYHMAITEHLVGVFESFDSFIPPDEYFTKSKIENQVRMDAKFLKEHLSK